MRLWKRELQRLADATGLTLTVCHFPPGTSKWNKIEHRLFCPITQNWRGRKVWPQRGWDYLKKLDYSAQRPRPRHAKAASLEEQAAYKKSWPPRWPSTARRSPGGRSRWGRSTSTGSG